MDGSKNFYEDLKICLDKQHSRIGGPIMKPHFLRLKSYVGTRASGEMKGIELLDKIDLEGKNVLIVEDLIDGGNTMKTVLNILESKRPK